MARAHQLPPSLIEGSWVLVNDVGDEVMYRRLVVRDGAIGEASGRVSALAPGTDPPPLEGPLHPVPTLDQARRRCQQLLDRWGQEQWVLASHVQHTKAFTEAHADDTLCSGDRPNCTVQTLRGRREQLAGIDASEARSAAQDALVAMLDCEQPDVEEVLRRLEAGAAQTVDDRLIVSAVRTGSARIVTQIVDAAARRQGRPSAAALFLATGMARADLVHLLIARGADVNEISGGSTALHQAAFVGADEVVDVLLAQRAQTHHEDTSGRTAIEIAAALGHEGVFRKLAPVSRDKHRRRAEALVERGRRTTALHPLTGPLLWAAYRGRVDEVRRLLDEVGVPVDTEAPDGRTPLFMAVMGRQDEVAALLRARGAIEP
ncbi:MAG: ankyrin repeat domain-containing protein [Deltaproteobacteria bacterium]|nr:ankyrin repeat domain-containing protein [Deltaproteobacteria bacterium]